MPALDSEFMTKFRAWRPSVPKVLRWIEALRSGQYSQARNTLCDATGLCCLGVAAKNAGLEVQSNTTTPAAALFLVRELGFECIPDDHEWYWTFATANDADGWTFAQIADWLEVAINLQRTIDLLENLPDERFRMDEWRYPNNFMSDERLMHNCGTAACIAGWAAIFVPQDAAIYPQARAVQALGLDDEQAPQLFKPSLMHARTRSEAIEVLKRFRDTGEIIWS